MPRMFRSTPAALASRGLGFEDVRNALVATTLDRPKGTLEGAHQTYTFDTNDQLFDAAAYDNVIIAYRNGAPVRVKDVGRAVELGAKRPHRRLVFRHQGGGPGDPAPSRRQHDRAGRHDQGDGSAHHGIVPAFGQSRPGVRPLARYPRGGARCAVYDDDDDRTRHPRHLFVFADLVGDDHPERRGAAVAAGDLCRDVCGGLQPRQHLA